MYFKHIIEGKLFWCTTTLIQISHTKFKFSTRSPSSPHGNSNWSHKFKYATRNRNSFCQKGMRPTGYKAPATGFILILSNIFPDFFLENEGVFLDYLSKKHFSWLTRVINDATGPSFKTKQLDIFSQFGPRTGDTGQLLSKTGTKNKKTAMCRVVFWTSKNSFP